MLTKGVPLRIAGTTGLTGTLASVDSELTLLYRRLTGQQLNVSGRVDNPFFLGARPIGDARRFTHREHDIYLVTRLDAYTVQQALGLVNRAQAPRPEGQIVLDQRGAATDRTGDDWLELAARRLAAQGHQDRVVLESTAKPARSAGPVLGYASWGSTDPANQGRSPSMAFGPGSIAANLASFDARTFREPPETWRPIGAAGTTPVPFEGSAESLIGDLIRDGVTGVSGQVGEPYLLGAVRPEILFPAYVAGFNLAEAFYLATPALSWQTVIVGDPLLAPFSRQALTRAEVEDGVHASTGLPGFFAKRRIAESSALLRGVPERAIELSLQAETRLDRDDRTGARRALEEAVRLAPQVSDWLLLLAGLEDQDREDESAIRRYEQVLAMQPAQADRAQQPGLCPGDTSQGAGRSPTARQTGRSARARQRGGARHARLDRIPRWQQRGRNHAVRQGDSARSRDRGDPAACRRGVRGEWHAGPRPKRTGRDVAPETRTRRGSAAGSLQNEAARPSVALKSSSSKAC